ncbi:MAG: phosphate butyryltransferase, partial [Bacteroidales bacterium]|nr:phosphate butyryltransferase [Bacteroidales bacterium]
MIKNFAELVEMAKTKETRRVAVAAAADKPVLMALKQAMEDGIAMPVLVGNKAEILRIGNEMN